MSWGNRLAVRRWIVLFAVCGAYGQATAKDLSPGKAEEILRAHERAIQERSVSMDVLVEATNLYEKDSQLSEHLEAKVVNHWGGWDLRTTHLFYVDNGKKYVEQDPRRRFFDGKRNIQYNNTWGAFWEDAGTRQGVAEENWSGMLDGFVLCLASRTLKHYSSILLESKSYKNAVILEENGQKLIKFEAKTDDGVYAVWLDSEAPYALVKLTNDVDERSPKAQAVLAPVIEKHREMRVSETYQEDGACIPTKGTVFIVSDRKNSHSEHTINILRTNIVLNPDLKELGAFVIDAKPGLPFGVPNTKLKYVWNGSQLVPSVSGDVVAAVDDLVDETLEQSHDSADPYAYVAKSVRTEKGPAPDEPDDVLIGSIIPLHAWELYVMAAAALLGFGVFAYRGVLRLKAR